MKINFIVLIVLLAVVFYAGMKYDEDLNFISNLNELNINNPGVGELDEFNHQKEICHDTVKENLRRREIRSPVSFSHNIIETKVFNDIEEANEYKTKYSSFNLADPICKNKNYIQIVSVLVEIKYKNPLVEPLTGMSIEKESTVFSCDGDGKLVERGRNC